MNNEFKNMQLIESEYHCVQHEQSTQMQTRDLPNSKQE
jgi:hypothetical protein